jgi:predicted Zn finger-like uncharacterized protein
LATIAGFTSSRFFAKDAVRSVMLIDCPGCAKSYHIVKAALGPSGRRVACPRCDTIWFVTADGDPRNYEMTSRMGLPGPFEMPGHNVEDAFSGFRMSDTIPAPSRPARKRHWIPSGLGDYLTGAAVVGVGMALVGLRADIVRLLPQSAAAYAAIGLSVNLEGLQLRNLHSFASKNGHETVLGIEGQIVNLRARATEVPPIRLAIRDAGGHELYSWTVTPQRRALNAEETALFRARLVAPPTGSQEILASFAPQEGVASR